MTVDLQASSDTPDGWRSRRLIEENRWLVNPFSVVDG